jgi:hypothetical protein
MSFRGTRRIASQLQQRVAPPASGRNCGPTSVPDMSNTTDKTGAIIPGGPGPLIQPPGGGPDDGSGPAEHRYPNAVDEDRPLSDRLGHDPSNLGDEVRDEGDITFPNEEPASNSM